jgi:hypothetical protein
MANTASTNLRALAADVRDIPRSAMITAAKAAKQIVADHGSRLAGSDGMRGKKKRGLKLKARDDIRPDPDGYACRIQGSVPGWVWMNTGTRPHPIRRRKKGPMRKMTVHHPGMPGRRAWRPVADEISREVPAILTRAVHEVIARGR